MDAQLLTENKTTRTGNTNAIYCNCKLGERFNHTKNKLAWGQYEGHAPFMVYGETFIPVSE